MASVLPVLLALQLPLAAAPVELPATGPCDAGAGRALFVSPALPHAKGPLRVMAVAEEAVPGARLVARAPSGEVQELAARALGGPPFGWVATVPRPARGAWRVALVSGTEVVACKAVDVAASPRAARRVREGQPAWRARRAWDTSTEDLYSLWVEHLFAAPPEADLTWRPFHEVLRDAERNLLFDHLGLGEDGPGARAVRVEPDCADFPFHLRGYFAWKLDLPFGYRPCSRGTTTRAPSCGELRTNLQPAERTGAADAFERVAWNVANTVHSSTARTRPEDEDADYYPVELTRRSLRPGTVYADPYGHTMVIVQWVQPGGDRAGVLLAADAQPDKTVGRRFFWRGSFLFPADGAVAGAGWKRFRPLRRRGDELVPLSNAQIARDPAYGDFSTRQFELGQDGFYEAMDALITPQALPVEAALSGILDALEQQTRRRVQSVDAAETWKREHPGDTVEMPEGGAIFLTTGPWEDYSTPARDMRLLIAMDAALALPGRVVRLPHRFRLPQGPGAQPDEATLDARLRALAGERRFTYTRSDGSPWTLSLADVLARTAAFEVAYNPNDCPEVRWGAPEGSEERATCRDRAPEAQRARMQAYRAWFKDRERPRE